MGVFTDRALSDEAVRGSAEEEASGLEVTMICSPRVMGMVDRQPSVSGRVLGGYPYLTSHTSASHSCSTRTVRLCILTLLLVGRYLRC